jgi:hypothetical protein
MWILTRLIITVASFLYRLFIRHTPKSFPMTHNGVPYSSVVSSSKKRSFFIIETPVRSSFICTLSEETTMDRWAKRLGFGDEIQVRDPEFNHRIFILGDHPLTADYLSSSKELRDRVCALIPTRVKSISITGETLKFVAQPGVPTSSILDDFVLVHASVQKIQDHAKSRFADPYYTRAVILESLLMAVMTYGWISFAEIRIFREDYHLDGWSLFKVGLGVAVVLAAGVVVLTKALLGGSSRAIRLMVENGLVMMLTLPVVGYEILSDLNRGLDDSEPIIVTSQIVGKHTTTHRSGRRRYTTYHLDLAPHSTPTPSPFGMPRRISVDGSLYQSVDEGGFLDCEISMGYLGFPWYRSMTPHSEIK